MFGVRATISFVTLLTIFLSIDHIDGQAAIVSTTIDPYTDAELEQHECLMKNRGRQKIISKCFIYYTMKNCSLLSKHMACYIHEKKKLCGVVDDKLIDKPFRELLKRKFIGNMASVCAQYLVKDLEKFACRFCNKTAPHLKLLGDMAMLHVTPVEIPNQCIELSLVCYAHSSFWKSQIRITTFNDQPTPEMLEHLLPSEDFGGSVEARVACGLAEKAWTYQNRVIDEIKCEATAIASDVIPYGCGQCNFTTVPLKTSGDQLAVTYGHTNQGCRLMHLACPTKKNYFSQMRYNDEVIVNATAGQTPIPPKITVVCSPSQSVWLLEEATQIFVPLKEVHCDSEAYARGAFNPQCNACTQTSGFTVPTDMDVQLSFNDAGCKTMIVKCAAAADYWRSSMSINQVDVRESPDPSKPLEEQLLCKGNDWFTPNGTTQVTQATCNKEARAIHVKPDECGTCGDTLVQLQSKGYMKITTTEGYDQRACKTLNIECKPPDASWKSSLQINGGKATTSQNPGESINVALTCMFNPLQWTDGSAGAPAITSIDCDGIYVAPAPLTIDCGACPAIKPMPGLNIIGAHPPTAQGCTVITIQCMPVDKTWKSNLIINNQISLISSAFGAPSEVGSTCFYEKIGINEDWSWMIKDQGNDVKVTSISCEPKHTSAVVKPPLCRECTPLVPAITLQGLDIATDYTKDNCKKLTLTCSAESDSFRSSITVNKGTAVLSAVGAPSVQTEVVCNVDKSHWVDSKGNNIDSIVCDPKAVAVKSLPTGCGACTVNKPHIELDGNNMTETYSFNQVACRTLTLTCKPPTSTTHSYLYLPGDVTEISQAPGQEVNVTMVCDIENNVWLEEKTQKPIDFATCVAAIEHAKQGCSSCTPTQPAVTLQGMTSEMGNNRDGCRIMRLKCTPPNIRTKVILEVSRPSKNSTLISLAPGESIKYQLVCDDKVPYWMDQKETVTDVECLQPVPPTTDCTKNTINSPWLQINGGPIEAQGFIDPWTKCPGVKLTCEPPTTKWKSHYRILLVGGAEIVDDSSFGLPQQIWLTSHKTGKGWFYGYEEIESISCQPKGLADMLVTDCGSCDQNSITLDGDTMTKKKGIFGKGCESLDLTCAPPNNKGWHSQIKLEGKTSRRSPIVDHETKVTVLCDKTTNKWTEFGQAVTSASCDAKVYHPPQSEKCGICNRFDIRPKPGTSRMKIVEGYDKDGCKVLTGSCLGQGTKTVMEYGDVSHNVDVEISVRNDEPIELTLTCSQSSGWMKGSTAVSYINCLVPKPSPIECKRSTAASPMIPLVGGPIHVIKKTEGINYCVTLRLTCNPANSSWTSRLDVTLDGNIVEEWLPEALITRAYQTEDWLFKSQKVTEINCNQKFIETAKDDCSRCVVNRPMLEMNGDQMTVTYDSAPGCKKMKVTCDPGDPAWLSEIVIDKVTTQKSSSAGAPVELTLTCAVDKSAWVLTDPVTSVTCTKHAWRAPRTDGCGLCTRTQNVINTAGNLIVNEAYDPMGCKTLTFQCLPSADQKRKVIEFGSSSGKEFLDVVSPENNEAYMLLQCSEQHDQWMSPYLSHVTNAECLTPVSPQQFGCHMATMATPLLHIDGDPVNVIKGSDAWHRCATLEISCNPPDADWRSFLEIVTYWPDSSRTTTMNDVSEYGGTQNILLTCEHEQFQHFYRWLHGKRRVLKMKCIRKYGRRP